MKPSKKKILSYLFAFSLSCGSSFVSPVTVSADASCNHEWIGTIYEGRTCVDAGYEIRRCQLCSYEERLVVPAKGSHSWGEWETQDEATCTEPGTEIRFCYECFSCEERVTPSLGGHKWSEWEVWAEPDCSTTGIKSRECAVCDKYESVEIPATGKHDWESWEVTRKPTIFNKGRKTRTCSECFEDEYADIPKLKATATDKQIQKMMKNFFTYAKAYNVPKIKDCFVKPSSVALFSSNKELANFCKKYNKKITYTFKSLDVSKNTATFKVSCKYYNAYAAHYNSMDEVALYILKHPNYSKAYVNKLQYQSLVKWNKKLGSDYSTKTITFKLKKVGSSWKIVSCTKAMTDMLHQNYQSAYDNYFR